MAVLALCCLSVLLFLSPTAVRGRPTPPSSSNNSNGKSLAPASAPAHHQQQQEVFAAPPPGFACSRVPALLQTSKGSLLAFAEGHVASCVGSARKDLQLRRSEDLGKTWVDIPFETDGTPGKITQWGSVAPVQLRESGRILALFTRNNKAIFMKYSDDDGVTWSKARHLPGASDPSWGYVALTGPAVVQMASGRLVAMSFQNPFPHWVIDHITHSHAIYSDDLGETWQIGGSLNGDYLSNECQAVDFGNNTLLVNARGLDKQRVQALSRDGGLTFEPSFLAEGLGADKDGSPASIVRHPTTGFLYLSRPAAYINHQLGNMTLHESRDGGRTWTLARVIDQGYVSYSALSVLDNGDLGLLYQRRANATTPPYVMPIDQIVFETISV